MAQSLAKNYIHIIFGTKNNFPFIKPQIDKVVAYIENQHEHHRKKSFKEEYLAFLKKYKVDYDERYIWE